ncbi:hypothetical protein N182_27755 [Sinorhizobium sp. GL2]|nr:hypothetical protein N182_27755 [Sinorhizobium sp. GL2]
MEYGAQVIALDRNRPAVAVSRYIKVDLEDPESIDDAVASLGAMPIHGLCNIAGVPETAGDEAVYKVNYLGLRRLTVGVLPQLANGASIVNLASTAGQLWPERANILWELGNIDDWNRAEEWIKARPVMFEDTYSKFKEALIVWTQSLASDWFIRYGVRMNSVSPGPVKTPIFDDFVRAFGMQNVEDIVGRTGRIAVPDDIAPPILFLLDDMSRWIVGANLPTEGGLLASRFASDMQDPRR